MEYSTATEMLLTGTYNRMREQLVAVEHENITLRAILNKYLQSEKKKLEEIIEEIMDKEDE